MGLEKRILTNTERTPDVRSCVWKVGETLLGLLHPEDVDTRLLWNADNYLPTDSV